MDVSRLISALIAVLVLLIPIGRPLLADEWDDVFGDMEAEIVATSEADSGLTQATLDISFRARDDNNIGFDPSVPLDLRLFSVSGGLMVDRKLGERQRIIADIAVKLTTEGKSAFVSEKSISGEDSDYLLFFYPLINELVFLWTPTETMTLETGLLNLKLGNSFFFNPVDFSQRYGRDGSLYHTQAFPGIKVSTALDGISASIALLPGITDPDGDKSSIHRLFQAGKNNRILLAQSTFYFWKGRLTAVGFLEKKTFEGNTGDYSGIGLEGEFPLTDSISLNAQVLNSNGEAAYEVMEVGGNPYVGFLTPGTDKERNVIDAQLQIDFPIFESLNVSLGYRFNGHGLSSENRDKLNSVLSDTPAVEPSSTRALVADSLHGFRFSPLLTSRHLGFINVSAQDLFEDWSFNLFGLFSPGDGSSTILGSASCKINGITSLEVGLTQFNGSSVSDFGAGYFDTEFSLGMKIQI